MSVTYFPTQSRKITNFFFKLPSNLQQYLSVFTYAATQPSRSCNFRIDLLSFERLKKQLEKEIYCSEEVEWWCNREGVWNVVETKIGVVERWWWMVLGEQVKVGIQVTEASANVIRNSSLDYSSTSSAHSISHS